MSTFNRYTGAKYSEFRGYLRAVASGQMSKSDCVNEIENLGEWKENIALPYQTEKKDRTVLVGNEAFDKYHVIVYETTNSDMEKAGGYMYQNHLLTTGDYYECSVYYNADTKKYRIALLGIPLIYRTYNND